MYDSDAEYLICSNMLEGKDCIAQILERIKPEYFFETDARNVFQMIRQMYLDGVEEINICTLSDRYMDRLQGLGFGGRSMFQALSGRTLRSDTKVLIERFTKAYKQRKLSSLADGVLVAMKAGASENEICQNVQDRLLELTDTTAERTLIKPMDMRLSMLEAVESRMDKEKRGKKVIYTKFRKLNQATNGFDKGDLVILSAESGGGKSAFAMNIAHQVGVVEKRAVLYLNSEMSTEQMGLRWSSFFAQVSHSRIRDGEITQEEFEKIMGAADVFSRGKLYTLNIPDLAIQNVIAEIHKAKMQYGVEMVVVDYIGRMDSIGGGDLKEWQVMKNAAKHLKTLAMNLNIVIIMVAQLTADGSKLAQGSYMKHEADLWMNIIRLDPNDAKDKRTLYDICPWNCWLEFKKARNVCGSTKIFLHFDGDKLTFTDIKKDALEIWKKENPKSPVPLSAQFGGRNVGSVPE